MSTYVMGQVWCVPVYAILFANVDVGVVGAAALAVALEVGAIVGFAAFL